jgi:hypothetical protein
MRREARGRRRTRDETEAETRASGGCDGIGELSVEFGDVLAVGVPKLVVVVLSGKSEFESASVQVGGDGGLAADFVEQGTDFDSVDVVGVFALEAIAGLGGFLEATRVDQVGGEVGEPIEIGRASCRERVSYHV